MIHDILPEVALCNIASISPDIERITVSTYIVKFQSQNVQLVQ